MLTPFNFQGFTRFLWRWLQQPGWSLPRAGTMLAFITLYPLMQIAIWISFLLDRIFFAKFEREEIKAPLFVVGNFRSGTTFLHRMLAKDEHYSSMQLWEILIAPSITMRKLLLGLAKLETLIGKPVQRLVAFVESKWEEKVNFHEVRFTEPEEDDYLGLHQFSVFVAGLSSGVLEEAENYVHFDQAIPEAHRVEIMHFYKMCLKRHIYANKASDKRYLAKNPALSPKIESVLGQFPDAKFIHLVRDPLETVPSFISMMRWSWSTIGTARPHEDLTKLALEMAGHWYRYPIERLSQLPENQHVVVNYHDLVANPAEKVREIYERLELPLSDDYQACLDDITQRQRSWSSAHKYNFEELGLSREMIFEHFADLYEQFDFPSQSDDSTPSDVECVA